jgi:hypothetical protein
VDSILDGTMSVTNLPPFKEAITDEELSSASISRYAAHEGPTGKIKARLKILVTVPRRL